MMRSATVASLGDERRPARVDARRLKPQKAQGETRDATTVRLPLLSRFARRRPIQQSAAPHHDEPASIAR